LDQLMPHLPLRQKVLAGLLIAVTLTVLIASYVWCGISPFQVWQKKQNAFNYLFGHEPSETDVQTAHRQAERLVDLMAAEEARSVVRKRYADAGKNLDTLTESREVEKLAQQILNHQTPDERASMIEREYRRLVDEKRGGFFPPETRGSRLRAYLLALLETVAIAIWGSLLAVLAAVPASLFAAKNILAIIAPGDSHLHRTLRWLSYFVVRRFLDACRGFNEFVMALMFVAVIGLGPFAGVLALCIHTFGVLGKVYSEAIEAIEPGQVEAVLSTGSSTAQVIAFAVLPQVLPTLVSYSLLRFESNVRSATILGFCGAGGIGFLMYDKLNGYLYREVATMMIMVILSVTLIDYLCARLRSRFI